MASEKTSLIPKSNDVKLGDYVLVIHGGAGTMSKATSTPEKIASYHAALKTALQAGYQVLANGGEAMDAVVAAVSAMEDNVLFNAGKGAVFNESGKNELEVSLMLSKPPASHPNIPATRRGLGLTLLTRTKNPSKAVRALYLAPSIAPHTFLSGSHAEELVQSLGGELVDPSYFFTENRWREHRRGLGLPEEPLPSGGEPSEDGDDTTLDMNPTGTVGAVALDARGCIASLTSTGGRTNKLVGRVGDTPIMGAGFWAEEFDISGWFQRTLNHFKGKGNVKSVGVSGTGNGDYFIRKATAASLVNRIRFQNVSVASAAKTAVQELFEDGGEGGVIVLDSEGNVSTPLNCPGMYRGIVRADGILKTAIFDDDVLE